MAEQTFRSPGFFEQEIDLSARKVSPSGTPAGVIGTSEQGPAFVPVTVGSFSDFETKFGTLDTNRFGPYAVREFLKHRTALTYMRLLGAGSNETAAELETTRGQGTVKNAGFVISGSTSGIGYDRGMTQFLVARHSVSTQECAGYPIFTDNASYFSNRDASSDEVNLVRGVIFTATGTSIQLLDNDQSFSVTNIASVSAKVGAIGGSALSSEKYFKIVVSSSAGTVFSNDDSAAGIRILSASLDPLDGNYIAKVMNTDPLKFQEAQHLLYLDYSVDHDIAAVVSSETYSSVAILSGTHNKSVTSGDATQHFKSLFGRYDTRYTSPRTTSFISQPFGEKEYNLFHFESLSDGSFSNDKYKISIANLRASTDPNNKFGSFEVQVREFSDIDTNTAIIERYPECNLDPNSDRYIARQIGDKKVAYDFDQEDPNERRLVIQGKYANVSQRIRVRMNSAVQNGETPRNALPFGFNGMPTIKTSDTLTDASEEALEVNGRSVGHTASRRLCGTLTQDGAGVIVEEELKMTGSIVPPMPFRFKVTRGAVSDTTSPAWVGQTGKNERVDGRFYWGVKTTKTPPTSSITNSVLNPNVSGELNPLVKAYTKFQGIEKLDALVTGSGAGEFNDNKFTLAKVALYNTDTGNGLKDIFTYVTGTAREHMIEASYIRNGSPNNTTYTVSDGQLTNRRFTLASLVQTSSVHFNRFSDFAKFTNLFYGGFDGTNILDENATFFKDKSLSSDTNGGAVTGDPDVGLTTIDGSSVSNGDNQMGEGRRNNGVASARRAVEIMTDPMTVNINILAIPGFRNTFISDHALDKTKEYSQAIYLMDSIKYDESGNRLYDDSTERVDVRETSEQFESRAIDNNYGATFFPDVFINDEINNQVVKVPSSVAALATLGYNDKVAFPWFAPAGFNRGALDFVVNVENRLTSADRDTLYDARVNPIAIFPRAGFVIFGQKSLQMAKSALDRVNVRRLMLEVKRQVVRVADKLLFEPNTAQTRARFVSQVTPLLALIQAQAGIEQFKVTCNESNNSPLDVEENKMNGSIIVVPTRAVEFIAIDFIITNSGVSFE